jgi:hypothetical protein
MTRRRLANGFIQLGLVMQVVFLLLVDWGSIVGILHQPRTPWGHVAGLVAVNVVLFPAAWIAWRWLRARGLETPRPAQSG